MTAAATAQASAVTNARTSPRRRLSTGRSTATELCSLTMRARPASVISEPRATAGVMPSPNHQKASALASSG